MRTFEAVSPQQPGLYLHAAWKVLKNPYLRRFDPELRLHYTIAIIDHNSLLQGNSACLCDDNSEQNYRTSQFIFIIIIYPLTAKVVGVPQMISQPVSSIFLCSPLPSRTWRTPGLSIPWCCLPTSSSVCLVFFPHFTVLRKMVLARPDERKTRPYHCTTTTSQLETSKEGELTLPVGAIRHGYRSTLKFTSCMTEQRAGRGMGKGESVPPLPTFMLTRHASHCLLQVTGGGWRSQAACRSR